MKTLFRKYTSLEQLQVERDQINQLLGYPTPDGSTLTYATPDGSTLTYATPDGSTLTYATIPEPTITYQRTVDGLVETKVSNEEMEGWTETDRFWLLTATHDLQELNPDIPLVSIEVLNDGRITIVDYTVESPEAELLVDNVKHCVIDLTPQAATQETIDKLVEDHNIVIV
jgi:hypothetical protein